MGSIDIATTSPDCKKYIFGCNFFSLIFKINNMRKNISLRIVLIAIMAITLSMIPDVQSADAKANANSSHSFLSYEKDARVGSGADCGQLVVAYVIGSTEEIDTGTYVWAKPQCTVPYPDGIITSLSGSTYGQSFYIVNGLVGAHAYPC
jgi:hypothetical protein